MNSCMQAKHARPPDLPQHSLCQTGAAMGHLYFPPAADLTTMMRSTFFCVLALALVLQPALAGAVSLRIRTRVSKRRRRRVKRVRERESKTKRDFSFDSSLFFFPPLPPSLCPLPLHSNLRKGNVQFGERSCQRREEKVSDEKKRQPLFLLTLTSPSPSPVWPTPKALTIDGRDARFETFSAETVRAARSTFFAKDFQIVSSSSSSLCVERS